MSKKKQKKLPISAENLRLDPERRLDAKFDSTSIAKFPVGDPEQMGVRVLDNCAEENIK